MLISGNIEVPRRIANSITPQSTIGILIDFITEPIHIAGDIIISDGRAIVPITIDSIIAHQIIADRRIGERIPIVIDGIPVSDIDATLILHDSTGRPTRIDAIINSGNIRPFNSSNINKEESGVPASAGRCI